MLTNKLQSFLEQKNDQNQRKYLLAPNWFKLTLVTLLPHHLASNPLLSLSTSM
jgi:hypothetical protein